jgi:flagellar biosynthesis protein
LPERQTPHRPTQAETGKDASAQAGGLRDFPALSQVAVALRHERGHDHIPRIVASGRGAIAEQILAVAFAEGVKVRQDADLAEVLSALDVGSDIPLEAFAAVAEILSYVYRANQTYRPRHPAAGANGAPS